MMHPDGSRSLCEIDMETWIFTSLQGDRDREIAEAEGAVPVTWLAPRRGCEFEKP